MVLTQEANMARAKAETVAFDDLLAFLKGKEDVSTRIISVTSSDKDAPSDIKLSYSYPLVTAGDDGFIDHNGVFVPYA